MMSREDGKHMSYTEVMESDIFGLLEAELRIYNKNHGKKSLNIDSAVDLI